MMRTAPFSLVVGLVLFLVPLSASAAAPTCTLTANPTTYVPGRTPLTLTLNSPSPGVTTGSVDNSIGILSIGVPKTISIAQTTFFRASVSNTEGTGSCSVSVIVSAGELGGMPNLPGVNSPPPGGGGGGGDDLAKKLGAVGDILKGLGGLQGALGGNNAQNQDCMGTWIEQCTCMQKLDDKGKCVGGGDNKKLCTCTNTTNKGVTSGKCMASGQCKGESTSSAGGPGGNPSGGLGQGLGALGDILKGISGLMGGGASGGAGAGGASGGAYPPGYGGCMTQYYYTSNTSGDPCAIYQPGTSGQLSDTSIQSGLSGQLLDLFGGTKSPVSGSIINQGKVTTKPGESLSATTTGQQGLTGDVRLNPGATVFANLRQGLSEVAGFFGGNTFGNENSQSALTRLCASRPWARSGFFASLAPDGFFDGLCRAGGYQVGQTTPATGGAQKTFNTGEQKSASPPIPEGLQPTTDIRAEPSSVRLGTRTYLFWTSKDVTSCTVRGPNFEQSTPNGAGATVPITGPTLYTITCTAADGRTVSDSVTVQLAI